MSDETVQAVERSSGSELEVARVEDATPAVGEGTGEDASAEPIVPAEACHAVEVLHASDGSTIGAEPVYHDWASQPFVYEQPKVFRHPNFGDAAIFLSFLVLGLLVTTGGLGVAIHFHWLGLPSFAKVQNDTHVVLATQLLIYLVGVAAAVPFFRMVWVTRYFEGIHWHAATAYRLRYRLVATALVCNVIALLGNVLLPFPQHAPIDKLFGSSGDAWLLMGFGVAVAPFFEEMIFRGFLLPAVATAWDWCVERISGKAPRPLDAAGNPVWSLGAMIFAALVVSAPFALMHSSQVGQAWGPLLLLYCVSLILCTVRLATRSLAASTLVHSAYNFMLFAVMLGETGGFRHMDKM
jgi:membrane protease YdiL (CAAX protease family)